MKTVFNFHKSSEYLKYWISKQKSQGHGIRAKMAASLGVSSSFISQILSAEKNLNPDQTHALCEFFAFNEIETEYFHQVVELERAATPSYKKRIEKKLEVLRKQALSVTRQIPKDLILDETSVGVYYSSWLYTGVRNLSAVPDQRTIAQLSKTLRVEEEILKIVIQFLVEKELCTMSNGEIKYGPSRIHLPAESPFVNKHHQNWRLRGINQMEFRREDDLFFSSPMSLSEKAAEEIRRLLPKLISQILEITDAGSSETVRCLNMDWFKY